ncbi:MAG: preprotein translocase subunit YajC [Planctomycetota bacterium]|jgi:preprotein translocase subunit YajC|nr:preprotein translocase subunit YajC [Planctomycetota bacterium]
MPATTVLHRLPSGKLLVLSQTKADPNKEAPVTAKSLTGQGPVKTTQEEPVPAGPGPSAAPQDCLQPALLFGGFLVLMYFLMIRPQQKQEKMRKAMLGAVKKGDAIVTSGGIHGQIAAIDEKTVTIKFGAGDGQRLKLDRSAVARVIPKGADKADES